MQKGPTIENQTASQRLLIVDGHAYAYRAFFAIRSLTSPTGKPTNAIYGFIRMITKMLDRLRPTHAIVIWDGGLAAERMALLPAYKAQRPSMPDDLSQQLDQIIEFLRASRVYSFLKEACEADDCIAALTHRATEEGKEVVIASSDKDFMQLVSPAVRLLNPHDKTEALLGVEDVRRKTGVEPTQIVDWLSMIGDSVDNIPGVAGVGPKTATDLLSQFGSIDALYQRIAEVKTERLRGNLQAASEVLRRNQQLIRLKHEIHCEVGLEELAVRPGDHDSLARLYSGWGFKTLLREAEEARSKEADFFKETNVGEGNAVSLAEGR